MWGGVRLIDRDIITGPLRASLYAKPCGGEEGGDIYYFSVCGQDQLTRIAIADVQGHGHEVSKTSEWLYELIRDSMHSLHADAVLRELNARVIAQGFEAMSTAALISYYVGDSHLYYSYAGHPPALLERRGHSSWAPLVLEHRPALANLPLGYFEHTEFDRGVLHIKPGDRLFLYTDGVTDVPDHTGLPRGSRWLIEHLDEHREHNVSAIKQSVTKHLAEPSPLPDDATLMVIEVH